MTDGLAFRLMGSAVAPDNDFTLIVIQDPTAVE
jgi:hypothetical protein